MKYRVNVTTGGSKTACYRKKDGTLEYITLLSGMNILEKGDWERIKDTDFMKKKLQFSEITFSEMVEEGPVYEDAISMEKAASFVGGEHGKDLLAEYAIKYGYKLKKNNNIDNMLKDLQEQVEGAE